MNAKHLLPLVTLAIAGLTATAQAASNLTATAPKTNSVMPLNFTLTAWPNATATAQPLDFTSGASNNPVRITSKIIIRSLNGVTNNGTAMNFSGGAQLLFKQILTPAPIVSNSLGINRQIIVRDRVSQRTVDTDISDFFASSADYQTPPSGVREITVRKLGTLTFANTNRLGLQLSSLLTITTASSTNGVTKVHSLQWDAQGTGETYGGAPSLIVSGTVSTGAARLE